MENIIITRVIMVCLVLLVVINLFIYDEVRYKPTRKYINKIIFALGIVLLIKLTKLGFFN